MVQGELLEALRGHCRDGADRQTIPERNRSYKEGEFVSVDPRPYLEVRKGMVVSG